MISVCIVFASLFGGVSGDGEAESSFAHYAVRCGAPRPAFACPDQTVGVSPDGTRVAIWRESSIEIWNSDLTARELSIPHEEPIDRLLLHESHVFAFLKSAASVESYATGDRSLSWRIDREGAPKLRWEDAAISPDGKWLVASGEAASGSSGGVLVATTGGDVVHWLPSRGGSVAIAEDSKHAVVASAGRMQFVRLKKRMRERDSWVVPSKVTGGTAVVRVEGLRGFLGLNREGLFQIQPGREKWRQLSDDKLVWGETQSVRTSSGIVLLFGRTPMLVEEGRRPSVRRIPGRQFGGRIAGSPKSDVVFRVWTDGLARVNLRGELVSPANPTDWESFSETGTKHVRWISPTVLESLSARFDCEALKLSAISEIPGTVLDSNARFVLTAVEREGSRESEVRVYDRDARTHREVSIGRVEDRVWEIALDGEYALSCLDSQAEGIVKEWKFELWRLDDGERVRTWRGNHSSLGVGGVVYRTFGKKVRGKRAGAESATGEWLWGGGVGVSTSPDGRWGGGGNVVIDRSNGEILHHFKAPAGTRYRRVLFDADSKIALAERGGRVDPDESGSLAESRSESFLWDHYDIESGALLGTSRVDPSSGRVQSISSRARFAVRIVKDRAQLLELRK